MKLSLIVLVGIAILVGLLVMKSPKEGVKAYNRYDTYGAYPIVAKAGESSTISVGSPMSPIAINN